MDWLTRWLEDGRDERLATHVVHTGDQMPATTARHVAALSLAHREPPSSG